MTRISQAFTVVVLLTFEAPLHGQDTNQVTDGGTAVAAGCES
jgi:hypothetical protein